MPNAAPFDLPFRWTVASDTRAGEVHMVDVSAFLGFGECSCEHFQYRLLPMVKDGRQALQPRCKHIIAAREAFADLMIQHLTKPRNEKHG